MAEESERTASETLIDVLEDFGEDEPRNVMVIWTTKSGNIAWSTSTSHACVQLGMLELTKMHVVRKAMEL